MRLEEERSSSEKDSERKDEEEARGWRGCLELWAIGMG